MSVKIDLTGRRFGSLVVLGLAVDIPGKKKKWLCKCDCGNEVIVQGANLQNGHTKHCLKCGYELTRIARTEHGKSNTPLFRVWVGIIRRCEDEKAESYKDYGGRGISICGEWRNDFQKFYDWSISNGYQKGLQIDRINNDGNYEPSNCRFVTRTVNANNKRSNVYIEQNGEKKTIAEWARHYGINYKYLIEKIERGLSLDEAVKKYKNYMAKTVKGVYERNGRYSVKITVDKTVYRLGTYRSFEEAKEARKQAELKYWGYTNIE